MYEHKTIVDKNGLIVARCVLYIDNKAQNFEMKQEQKAVEFCNKSFVKPQWNGSIWEESATEEEIKAWKEENTIVQKTTTEETLLREVAELKIIDMKKDAIINSTLKTIAELKVKIMNMEEGK
ncbi:hypothetical protein [Clostridium sp.]|uniref:hypothetical protein n=1 Tax=Clostridium sp. TaxID=1506 RepID=UPI00291188A0|nr:hypothetical protein [Clostridium sp.]MDU4478625.1 hypothetical protein [Clostridium sp.]